MDSIQTSVLAERSRQVLNSRTCWRDDCSSRSFRNCQWLTSCSRYGSQLNAAACGDHIADPLQSCPRRRGNEHIGRPAVLGKIAGRTVDGFIWPQSAGVCGTGLDGSSWDGDVWTDRRSLDGSGRMWQVWSSLRGLDGPVEIVNGAPCEKWNCQYFLVF